MSFIASFSGSESNPGSHVAFSCHISLDSFHPEHLLTEKKCTPRGLCVKFYLGQNEDYSPGDSISESSEGRLQTGEGRSAYKQFW